LLERQPNPRAGRQHRSGLEFTAFTGFTDESIRDIRGIEQPGLVHRYPGLVQQHARLVNNLGGHVQHPDGRRYDRVH